MNDMWYGDVGIAFDILHGSNLVFGTHIFLELKRYTSSQSRVMRVMKMEETDQIVASRSLVAPMRRVNLMKFACEGI